MNATKAAASLAAELGVELEQVKGTGKDGRVTVGDVRKAAEDGALTVVAGVKRDLAEIAARDPQLARSGLAASALSLAETLDSRISATARSNCARALRETLAELRDLMPPKKERDSVDDLRERGDARRSRASAPAG